MAVCTAVSTTNGGDRLTNHSQSVVGIAWLAVELTDTVVTASQTGVWCTTAIRMAVTTEQGLSDLNVLNAMAYFTTS